MVKFYLSDVPEPAAPPDAAERKRLEQAARSGADWFLWIAGLSALNSVTIMMGDTSSLFYGLGFTLVVDVMGRELGLWGKWLVLALNVPVTAFFVLIGLQARKKVRWAFWSGIVLYALDSLVFIAFEVDWWGFGFHCLALLWIWQGQAAANRLREFPPAGAPVATSG